MLDQLRINLEDRKKAAFYCGDFNRPLLDLYFGFIGEPKTNPPAWYETLKWGAGKGVEEKLLQVLKDSGIVAPNYDQKTDGRVEIREQGISINGYIDAWAIKGFPIECKSINNANKFDIKRYEDGYPRENYVGQLALYMYGRGVDYGGLFVASIDGLHYFYFHCKKVGDGLYKCGNVTIDVKKEIARWVKFYNENVVPGILPHVWEYRYKYDLRAIDWKRIPVSTISKVRTGKKVIGDYQVSYSDWKDKIIALQNECLGYTKEEMDFIMEATKGYTTWRKK